jgi:hypothetical protein
MSTRIQPIVVANNLAEFFSGAVSFVVPPYQRQYAWEEEQIIALLEDLGGFYKSDDPYYILGQVILAPQGDISEHRFAVVDGQQRLTSLYLVLICLLEQFQSFGISHAAAGDASSVMSVVRDSLFKKDLRDGSERQRFTASKQADGWLGKLLNQESLPSIEINPSQANLKNNFQYIASWVRNNLNSAEALVEYTKRFLYNVYVVSATLTSEEQALDIFEKLNSRGKALNSAELLKNLLFMSVPQEKYETVSQDWDTAAEEVFKVKPHKAASMGYLLQAMLQPYTGEFVSNKLVYKQWQERLRDGSIPDAEAFSKNIVSSAQSLALIGSPRVNEYNKGLMACRHFGVVQHLPAVLAAVPLRGQRLFDAISEYVDARVAISLFAEEGANSLNADFWSLSKKISELSSEMSEEDALAAIAMPIKDFSYLVAAARPRFAQMNYTNARDKKRIRFALATIANHVEGLADNIGEETTIEALLKTRTKASKGKAASGYDLDHIFPQSLAVSATFDASWGKDWVHSIGNLCLLHPADNTNASAGEPISKSRDYASSKLLLTKSLASNEHIDGLNSRLGSALGVLEATGSQKVDDWFFAKAERQTEFYFEMFSEALKAKLGLKTA